MITEGLYTHKGYMSRRDHAESVSFGGGILPLPIPGILGKRTNEKNCKPNDTAALNRQTCNGFF